MLQRFASALFGGDAEEVIGSRAEEEQEEQEEDWILVDCLAEACTTQPGHAPSSQATPLQEDQDGEEDLVMVPWPSRSPSPLLRYASSTSLHSTDEEEEEEEQEEEGGFLRLDAPPMAESWLVTPPPCFTGGGCGQQVAVSCSPLENLLIEHPSMSVYARHGLLLRRGRGLLPEQGAPCCPKTAAAATAKGKRKDRRRRCRRHLAHSLGLVSVLSGP